MNLDIIYITMQLQKEIMNDQYTKRYLIMQAVIKHISINEKF